MYSLTESVSLSLLNPKSVLLHSFSYLLNALATWFLLAHFLVSGLTLFLKRASEELSSPPIITWCHAFDNSSSHMVGSINLALPQKF